MKLAWPASGRSAQVAPGCRLATCFERCLQFVLPVEVILDTLLLRPVTKTKCSIPATRFVDCVLDQQPVDDSSISLGIAGRGQEPRAKSSDREPL